MGIASNILRTIRHRPFLIGKYARESTLFLLNMGLLHLFKGKNLTVGSNPHVISPFAFQAEQPDSRIEIGDDVIVWDRTKISAWGTGRVTIGHCCSFGHDTTIHCRDRVDVGNYALISWNVQIIDFDAHSINYGERMAEIEHGRTAMWPGFARKRPPVHESFVPHFAVRPVIIEDGVWIGAHAIILKGARIGRGSIIGAGSVVGGEIPPMSVAVGNPARVVRNLEETAST